MDISSLNSYYNSLNDTASSGNALGNLSDSDLSKESEDELMEVCKEFESYFLEQVFKGMQTTVDVFKSEESSSGMNMSEYFGDIALADISSQSTEQNGLGLAQTLYEQMKRNYNLEYWGCHDDSLFLCIGGKSE